MQCLVELRSELPMYVDAQVVSTELAKDEHLMVVAGTGIDVYDGSHTFGELYAHRNLLLLALCKASENFRCWRSRQHYNEPGFSGFFLVQLYLNPTVESAFFESARPISYHLPNEMWEYCHWMETHVSAPVPWDGHTPDDVLRRLMKYIQG